MYTVLLHLNKSDKNPTNYIFAGNASRKDTSEIHLDDRRDLPPRRSEMEVLASLFAAGSCRNLSNPPSSPDGGRVRPYNRGSLRMLAFA